MAYINGKENLLSYMDGKENIFGVFVDVAGGSGKEPVAYLYNGVRLPNIDEAWTDKTTLPYALITDRSTLEPTLVLTSLPLTTAVSGWLGGYVKTDGECLYMRYVHENGAWTILDELQTISGTSEGYSDIVWSNYDIPYTDGSVYLAASKPVPIYE